MKKYKSKKGRRILKTPNKKKMRQLQTPEGRIVNCNQANVDFTLTEDDLNVMLDVVVFKFLDTPLCDVDVQPTHVKVWIKGQILQLVLPAEVKPDSSIAKRSQITEHLLRTMPKLNPVMQPKPKPSAKKEEKKENKGLIKLEVDPNIAKKIDITNIVSDKKVAAPLGAKTVRKGVPERPNSENFVDNDEAPPLM